MEALKWKLPAYKHPADSPAFHSIKFYWTKGDKFVKISICKRVEAVNIARQALWKQTSERWCKANVHWSFEDNECCRLLKMQLKVNSMLSRWLFAAFLPSLMHCCEHNERLIKFMNAAVVARVSGCSEFESRFFLLSPNSIKQSLKVVQRRQFNGMRFE